MYFYFNQTSLRNTEKREELSQQFLPHKEEYIVILSPFYTDYGYNCRIRRETFINHNACLMDRAPVTIGGHCFIGPNYGKYTPRKNSFHCRCWKRFLTKLIEKENIHEIPYIPEYYLMRDRCKAVVQTGDYGIHAQAILIAGYPSDDIPMDWLRNGLKIRI